MRENKLPTKVYMLRNKRNGKLYRRKFTATPLVWTNKQGPASAKGSIEATTRQDWHIIPLKVADEA